MGAPALTAQQQSQRREEGLENLEKKHSIQVFRARKSINGKVQLLRVNSKMYTLCNSGPFDLSHLHCHQLKMERSTLPTDVYALWRHIACYFASCEAHACFATVYARTQALNQSVCFMAPFNVMPNENRSDSEVTAGPTAAFTCPWLPGGLNWQHRCCKEAIQPSSKLCLTVNTGRINGFF